MSGVPTWLYILGAVPLAWLGVKLILKGVRSTARWIVRIENAAELILTELVPNEGETLLDKVDEALLIGRENQRALESHLIAHGWQGGEDVTGAPI